MLLSQDHHEPEIIHIQASTTTTHRPANSALLWPPYFKTTHFKLLSVHHPTFLDPLPTLLSSKPPPSIQLSGSASHDAIITSIIVTLVVIITLILIIALIIACQMQ
jgi:hypothetical protein